MVNAGVIAIRHAGPPDVPACAAIKNAWIDEAEWMPRVHPAGDMERHYRSVFPDREVFVAGDGGVEGFLVLDGAEVTALFVARAARGRGVGAALLGRAKAGRDRLALWTFVANEGARRFYAREGFREVRRTEGENEEGLPDVLLRWERVR
jgi:GNAT superfamily N-acetyltransferase